MRWHEIFKETATAGATASGNVATSIPDKTTQGAIGVGFDPSADHGIYEKPKKKPAAKKASVLRR